MGSDFYSLFIPIYLYLFKKLIYDGNILVFRGEINQQPNKKNSANRAEFSVSALNYFVQHLLHPSTFSVGQFILARL